MLLGSALYFLAEPRNKSRIFSERKLSFDGSYEKIPMNRIVKLAVLSTAVCALSGMLFACGNDAEINQYYEIVKLGSESAVALDVSEILVHESVTADKDIEGCYLNGTSETYIHFIGDDASDFELNSISSFGEGDAVTYELIKNDDMILELYNGSGNLVDDAVIPDFFENFRLGFTAQDIKRIDVGVELKGVKSYKFTMSKAYINSFDSEADGVATDCTDVSYTYYIDPYGVLEKVVSETALTVTYGDKTQNVVRVIDSAIA